MGKLKLYVNISLFVIFTIINLVVSVKFFEVLRNVAHKSFYESALYMCLLIGLIEILIGVVCFFEYIFKRPNGNSFSKEG